MLEGCTPWPTELASRYRELGYWRDQPLGGIVDRGAERFGEREALILERQRVSYRELKRRVDRLALHLLELGLRPRDRVVVHLNNTPEFVYVYFACAKTGVVPVMALLPHRFTEIRHLAEFSGAVAYVGPSTLRGFDYQQLAREVRQAVPSVRQILVAGDGADPDVVALTDLLNDPIEERQPLATLTDLRPDPADVALFLLSGGTTGLPKLIPRTHNDYEYNSRASGAVCNISLDTVYLVVLPISHNFPLASPGLQSVLQAGGRGVLCDSTDPPEAFRLIEQERVTHTALVPALAMRWMDSPERGRFDLSSLRVLQVGGAKLNPEPARRVRPRLGCQLQQVFGMAEGLLNYTRLDDPEEEIVTTQGRPCSPDDEIRIVDEEGRDVTPGEPGELLARGPYTIRGYYNVPEHNQRAFTPDGYYRSGDVVRLSPRGNLIVEGRAKDLINRGGEKISAEEVENLVLAHPSVFNAAAVAMPDPVLGERTCVYVILRPGAGLTLTELVTFLEAQQIARFKLPERLEVVEKFPLTNVGKVSKKDLREDIARKLASERAAQLIQRLQAAVADVLRQADRLGPQDAYGRPEADAWSAAEILAHLVEMLPYWSEQAQAVAVRSQNGEPFGRTHDDPQRITAVRDHAHDDPRELVVGLRTSLDRAMALLRAIPSACWLRTGRHARRGEMTVAQIVEQFLVEHAEEHAHQLAATLDTEAHA